jgi:DNA-binding NarL/FixJ family response regulator
VLTQVASLSQAGNDPLDALSRREREVLELVVSGGTSKEIAARLEISPASVDTYRSRIMLKLDIDDLPGLVRFAIRHGIASA